MHMIVLMYKEEDGQNFFVGVFSSREKVDEFLNKKAIFNKNNYYELHANMDDLITQ